MKTIIKLLIAAALLAVVSSPLFAQAILNVKNDTSVSSLFD